MESFHEFYVMVSTNYQNHLNDIDAKISVNPLLDCEPETTANETTVKIENDRFDSCVSNYEAIYIPSTTYWDDSNKQIDRYKNEESAKSQKQINDSNKIMSTNEASIVLESKQKEESDTKSVEKAVPKRKRAIKTRTASSETKTKQHNRAKEAIITIDGVM